MLVQIQNPTMERSRASSTSRALSSVIGEVRYSAISLGDMLTLVGTWGTEGFVMGGLDVNMPGLGYGNILGPFYDQELLKMVENGTISETRLGDMVVRVITPLISTGQLDNPLPSTVINSVGIANWPVPATYRNVQQESTVELIRKISADGTILLKNTGGLPLKAPQNIAVIGQDAGPNVLGLQGCGKLFRDCGILNNNGTLSMGGGSGYAWPQNLITPLEAIQTKALDSRSLVQFVLHNTATSVIAETITGSALPIGQPDVCLVFAERYMRENMDRNDLGLNIANWTHSEDIILQTAASCNNTIVVLHVGGPVIMEAWIDHPNITAVVAPLFPGEQTGPGLVDFLWGHVSPSGKLPFTSLCSIRDQRVEADMPQLARTSPTTLQTPSHTTTALDLNLTSPRSSRLTTGGLTPTTLPLVSVSPISPATTTSAHSL
jgi:beta-glucosidase